jgi:hypothetical protein
MEVLEDEELVIRNVETDIQLGTAVPFWMNNPNDPIHKDADKIATISTNTVPNPLKMAPVAIANYEAMSGYPGIKDGAKNPDPHRIEWLLGAVLADGVSVLARAWLEGRAGGLTTETKSKWGDLVVQLHKILSVSRFGSFDAEHGVTDPYFANGSGPRMSFAAAAQHYGMLELQIRFPDVSETTLKALLSWPLDLLNDTLNRLSPQ